jgi:predicted DNA-binding protein
MPTTREMQKTTLHLAPELHKRLRLLAIEKGVTFTELMREAVERYLKAEEPKIRRPR